FLLATPVTTTWFCMTTTTALRPSPLKKPFSSAMTNGSELLPVRVVRPSVIFLSCAPDAGGSATNAASANRMETRMRTGRIIRRDPSPRLHARATLAEIDACMLGRRSLADPDERRRTEAAEVDLLRLRLRM